MNGAYRRTVFSLEGKVALLTGASGHLGRSMAAALASAGAHVILSGRRAQPLEELRDRLRANGSSVELLVGDIGTAEVLDRLDVALTRPGRLDVLVNNAYAPTRATLESVMETDYLNAYRQVVVTAAALARRTAAHLRVAGQQGSSSSIVNIASMYASVSPDPSIYKPGGVNPPHYGPAKAALLQWTRYAAVQWAHDRVRVNAISPGPFPSPQAQEAEPALMASLEKKVPMGRLGRPEELQGALLFLASDAASFVTGSDIVVDGGWTAW